VGLVQLAGERLELGFGGQRGVSMVGLAHPGLDSGPQPLREMSLTLRILCSWQRWITRWSNTEHARVQGLLDGLSVSAPVEWAVPLIDLAQSSPLLPDPSRVVAQANGVATSPGVTCVGSASTEVPAETRARALFEVDGLAAGGGVFLLIVQESG